MADPRGSGTNGRQVTLDAVSKLIIEQLQIDGRRSYAEIGKVVGLSEAAVRQRVQKLLEAGVMQIVAVTDPLQMGFAREALIGVVTDGKITGVGTALADDADIDYVVVTAGTFDLVCEAVAVDDDHLLEIITRIRAIPGVTRTETFLYLKLMKQTYDWGAN
jgi:Lrp/AsnC family transcriptional regulator, regulator for asnA, asnC and gidA